ncbi:MAG TPA: DUF721 domain-containing protein [Rhodospirillales bacterium]|nr:DUF721 domain-containing protein [Rhodospirillales bacterium]
MRPVQGVQWGFRRQGLRALGESVAPLTAPLAGKRGFAAARLLGEWPSIVGPHLAARSRPEQLSGGSRGGAEAGAGGTLVVRVASGPMALELQHQEPLICERINVFFGWRAVARLRLVHGPLPRPPAAPPPPAPLADDATIDAAVGNIEDPALAAALRALAARVLARGIPRD